MAGAGYRNFQTGEVLTATNVNTYLNEQTVMVFADAAARTTALSGVLAEGMVTYLKDTNQIEVYNGSSWVAMVRTDVANTFTTGTQTVETGGGGTVGLVIKGVLTQSANLQEWRDSSGAALGGVSSIGSIFTSGRLSLGYTSAQPGYRGLITNFGATTDIVLAVKGAASQTADLQQWQNSAASVVGYMSAGGDFWVTGATRSLFVTNRNNTGSYIDLSSNVVGVYSRLAATVGLVVKGAASQTANLTEWQDSAGTVLSLVRASGQINSGGLITGVQLSSTANNSTTIGLLVRGAASQSADLQQWQSSAGTTLARVDSAGIIISGTIQTTSALAQISEENSGGRFRLTKATAAASNPGSGVAKIYLRDGTNAGTLKLVVRAGASGAETTILDNIPQ